MKKFIKASLILLFILLIFGCDKEKSPYIENNSETFHGRNVLVEDYTAHYCVNCPRAARELENIVETYGDKVIPLAIHVGLLAQPGNSPYDLDLRTQVGNDLDNEFVCSTAGLPNGMISRTAFNSSILVGDGDWPSAVASILAKKDMYNIKIKTNLDTANRKLTVITNTIALEDTIQQHLNICVYLYESHIIGAQRDQEAPGGEVVDYEFNHILRTSLNGTWGEEIVNGAIKKGDVFSKTYEDFDINDEWVMENLGVVVFAYDVDSKEVMEADKLDLFKQGISNEN